MTALRRYWSLNEAFRDYNARSLNKSQVVYYDIFAVIEDSKAPRSTRGQDFAANVYLSDPLNREGGLGQIELVVFGKEALLPPGPEVLQRGDILRIHCAQPQYKPNNGRPQLCLRLNPKGEKPPGKPRWDVFPGPNHNPPPHDPSEPYCSAMNNCTVTPEDEEWLEKMRTALTAPPSQPPQPPPTRLISALRDSCYCDPPEVVSLVAKVLAVDARERAAAAAAGTSTGGQVAVFLWEGSDAAPCNAWEGSMPHVPDHLPESDLVVLGAGGVKPCPLPGVPPSNLPSGEVLTVPTLPPRGSHLPLLVPAGMGASWAVPGAWVAISHAAPFVSEGQVQALLLSCASISLLGDEAARQREGEAAARVPLPPRLTTRCVPRDPSQPPVPLLSVREVVTALATGALPEAVGGGPPWGTVRVHARAVRRHPEQPSQWVLPVSGLPPLDESYGLGPGPRTLVLKVLLEDGSGQVDAVLVGSAALQLVTGGSTEGLARWAAEDPDAQAASAAAALGVLWGGGSGGPPPGTSQGEGPPEVTAPWGEWCLRLACHDTAHAPPAVVVRVVDTELVRGS